MFFFFFISKQILQRSLFLKTGSGFKSLKPYRSGFFSAAIKLQPGYTAGVITSFYVRMRILYF